MATEFRTYDKAARDKYAKSGVALPDGSFPIPDAGALSDAIHAYGRAGNKAAAKRHIIKRAKALGKITLLPSDWVTKASFDTNSVVEDLGDTVIRTGKYFECGDYPDKGFSLSEEESDAVLALSEPLELNIEHGPTFLDGKLGKITKLWREGKDILANYVIPKWLHTITEGKPLKISSEWDIETKSPVGGAIVLNPRVADAAIMAAFSQANMAGAMQSFHDSSVYKGAECKGKSLFASTDFLTVDELKAIQHVHDFASKNGASCDLYASRNAMYSQDAGSSGEGDNMTEEQEKGFFARMKAHIFGDPAAVTPLVGTILPTAEFTAVKSENEELKAKIAAMEANSVVAEFGAAQFTALKTAAKDIAIVAFGKEEGEKHHATIDALTDPKMVETMRASFQAVADAKFPPNGGTRQTSSADADNAADEGTKLSPEKKAALMKATPLGAKTLANMNGGNK